MTSTAAILKAFLEGETLSIKTAFLRFSCSNLPRECGRSVERKFGVILERKHQTGVSKYGVACTWTDYKLPFTSYNKDGIEKIKAYLAKENIEVKSRRQPQKGNSGYIEQSLFQ